MIKNIQIFHISLVEKKIMMTYHKVFFQDKHVKRVNLLRNRQELSIFFTTEKRYRLKSFRLKPNGRYKYHRLVIDLYDKKSTDIVSNVQKINKKINILQYKYTGFVNCIYENKFKLIYVFFWFL